MISCQDNAISGLDFNSLGTFVASIDQYGVCLISDINTNDYSFHLQMSSGLCNLPKHFFFLSLFLSFYHRNLFPCLFPA